MEINENTSSFVAMQFEGAPETVNKTVIPFAKPQNKNRASTQNNAQQRAQTNKRNQLIEFREDTTMYDDVFIPLDKYKEHKANVRKWDPKKLILPSDSNLDTDMFFKYELAPGIPVKFEIDAQSISTHDPTEEENGAEKEDEEVDIPGFAPMEDHFGEDDVPLPAGDPTTQDVPLDTATTSQKHISQLQNVFHDSGFEIATSFEGAPETNRASTQNNAQQRAQTNKRNQLIEFREDTTTYDDVFIPLDKYKEHKANVRKWDPKKLILPSDSNLDTDMFFKYDLAPGIPVEFEIDAQSISTHDPTEEENGAEEEDEEVDVPGFAPMEDHFGEDDVPLPAGDPTTQDVPLDTATTSQEHISQVQNVFHDSGFEIATSFEGAPETVNKTVIPFAKPQNKNRASTQNNAQQRAQTNKLNQLIEFREDTTMYDDVFIPLDKYKERKANVRKWDPKKLILPSDSNLDTDMFFKYDLAPGIPVKFEIDDDPTEEENGAEKESEEVDVPGFAPMEDHFGEDDVPLPAGDPTTQDVPLDTATTSQEHISQVFSNVFHDSGFEIATSFEGAPETFNKTVIPFVKRAKVIDMKNLKRSCHKIIESKLAMFRTAKETPPEQDLPAAKGEIYAPGAVKLSEVFADLPSLLTPAMQSSVSYTIALDAVLHVASEHSLHLFPNQDNTDAVIRRVAKFQLPLM